MVNVAKHRQTLRQWNSDFLCLKKRRNIVPTFLVLRIRKLVCPRAKRLKIRISPTGKMNENIFALFSDMKQPSFPRPV